ncbi:tetratricopeptide repeat protein [Sphingomonas piscis]|uniref:Tetratricopeptide repeat protein n=1 Tax=Sphingomonas piscis TaxID=2714943 RepID=A0A6G7YLJ5_9SPHN|nr:tetratricopeptide repeat protein [Sphingomonas piscis]QIK77612.1 tetratricopeptide repeat protein [Sphingomonas piscis]
MTGDHVRSAALFAGLAEQSRDPALTRKAISTAVEGGDLRLALRLARSQPLQSLPIEAKLLLIAEPLRQGRIAPAIALASSSDGPGSVRFLVPLLNAWLAAERGDLAGSLAGLNSAPANGVLAPFRDEQRAFILLKFKRSADAAPFVERALGAGGARRARLRMIYADGFLRAGDRERAAALVAEADDPEMIARIARGKAVGQRVETAAQAISELLTGVALDLSRGDKDLPVSLLNVARFADPANSSAPVIQGLLLDSIDRPEAAIASFRAVPNGDGLAAQARTYEVRTLLEQERLSEAEALAGRLANRSDASVADYQRLAIVYRTQKKPAEAAAVLGRAISLAMSQGVKNLWPLYYERAVAFEQANRWPESKNDLQTALRFSPDEPTLLNFLGYTMLERGEQLDAAEAMIRKASRLAPDEPAITDSLGWALYKRGQLPEAIDTLQQAAAKDVAEPEIHEHLGDALYTAGRRYEARFAWNAALVTAEEDAATRIKAKLQSGLSAGNAAP